MGLAIFGSLAAISCTQGTYPVDLFYEMHYQQTFKSHEPPRMAGVVGAVPVDWVPVPKSTSFNTGEHLWWIPVGETPDAVLNHPDLQGLDIPNTGYGLRVAQMMVTPNLLIHTGNTSDGTPMLFAVDKQTGEELARVEAPAESSYGIMTYVHKGRQYIMLQTRSKLTAMALTEF